MRYCPRCGAKNTSGDPVCRRCGQKLYGLLSGQERVTCQACGTATPPDAAFCLGCGRPAGAQVSRPPVAAPPVEVAARPSAPRPRVELSGPVASDDGLESPRAKGCLIAVLAVALVATTGASLLFRPAQHTLVLE